MTAEHELSVLKRAFEKATERGYTYEYEGWGGRRKTGHKGAEEYRASLLEKARSEIGALPDAQA